MEPYSRFACGGTYRICHGKYIGFALADISSLREQTYRLCRGLGFADIDKKEWVCGLAVFLMIREDGAVKVPFLLM